MASGAVDAELAVLVLVLADRRCSSRAWFNGGRHDGDSGRRSVLERVMSPSRIVGGRAAGEGGE